MFSNVQSSATIAEGSISGAEKAFFHKNGFVILRNVLSPQELDRLRQAMSNLAASKSTTSHYLEDFKFGKGQNSGEDVLRRIDYVIDKSEACKVLLGHPYILRSVEDLMGPDFIPTWDALVLKSPGEGIVVPWHRDSQVKCAGETPIFNVDFYLDDADEETCVWGIPGSQDWSTEKVEPYFGGVDFTLEDAVPIPVNAGDVILHNIKLLHGSPPNQSPQMRRVIYYEFRTASVEIENGPHRPDYIPLKQEQLLACLEKRQAATYCTNEESFVYSPPTPFDTISAVREGGLPSYRFEHAKYYR